MRHGKSISCILDAVLFLLRFYLFHRLRVGVLPSAHIKVLAVFSECRVLQPLPNSPAGLCELE